MRELPSYDDQNERPGNLRERYTIEHRHHFGASVSPEVIALWAYRINAERWDPDAVFRAIATQDPAVIGETGQVTPAPPVPAYDAFIAPGGERATLFATILREFRTHPPGTVWGAVYVRFGLRRTLDDAVRWVRGEPFQDAPFPLEPTDPEPGPGPDPGPSRVAPLTIHGTDFLYPDGGIWKMRSVSGFTAFQDWLEGRHAHLETFLAWARGQRVNCVTYFLMWRVTGFDPRVYGDRFYPAHAEFQRWLAARGFHANPVLFCDQDNGSPVRMAAHEQDAHFTAARRGLLDSSPDEYVNEDWQNGNLAYRFPHGYLASRSAYQDGAEEGYLEPGSLMGWTSQQFARKFQWVRGSKNLLETARLGIKNGEGHEMPGTGRPAVAREPPLGIFEHDIPWSRTANPEACFDFYAGAELFGAGWCLHGDRTNVQTCTVPGPNAQACADAVTAVVAAGIPPHLAGVGRYTAGHLDDCPLVHRDRYGDDDDVKDERGALRTFAMIDPQDGRAWVLVMQPGPAWRPEARNGWRVVEQRGPVYNRDHGGHLILCDR